MISSRLANTPATPAPLADGPIQVAREKKSPAMPDQAPWLSVIIVNYGQWEQTAALARQVLGHGSVEVVVVDNNSPPQREATRLRRRPGISLRCWKRNRGFARAVNEGCRLARGHWFLLLNPDVSVDDRFVENVLTSTARFAALEPRPGIVGFRLHDQDGSWQRSTGEFPTLARTFFRLLLPRARRKYNSPPADRASQVPWVTGCCMLMRRDCFEQLGGFDSDYFLYYEDVDLCRRARQAGWSVWYEPSIKVTHHHPLHGRQVPASLRVLTRHAFLVYCFKHWPRWQFRFISGIVKLESRMRQWWASRKGHGAHAVQFRELRAIARDIGKGSAFSARRRLARIVEDTTTRQSLADVYQSPG
jgi:GT2 family glycosyltransferase